MASKPDNIQWVDQVREHFSEMETLHFKKNLNSALKVLKSSTDYNSKESLKCIDTLRKAGRPPSIRKTVGDHLAKEGYAELFVKMWQGYMHKFITHDEFVVNEMFFLTRAVISRSPELALAMGKSGALGLLLNQLKEPNIVVDKLEDELVVNYVLVVMVIVLLAIYNCSDNRDIYRKANAISILTPYVQRLKPSEKDTSKRLVKLGALLTLSYILNESETKTLEAADLKLCVKFTSLIHAKDPNVKASMTKTGISTALILDGINHVALLNDTNKVNFVEGGMVPLLSKILQTPNSAFTEEEKILAARALWNLGFVECNRRVLSSNTDVIQGLQVNTQAQNKTLRDTCTAALWEIFEGNVGSSSRRNSPTTSAEYKTSEAKYKKIPSLLPSLDQQSTTMKEEKAEGKKEEKGDESEQETDHIKVMISYQWDAQNSMLKLRDKLRSNNKIKVWMDVDEMKGNILEAMADAVETSDVVLVCLSRRYKESLNCRTEASYAYKLKKPIVPLMVEDNYVPDGWLGALVGVELYYSLCQDHHLSSKFPEIKKAIEEKCICCNRECNEQSPMQKSEPYQSLPAPATPPPTPTPPASTSQVYPATTWSTHRVAQWLDENDLSELVPNFNRIKGTHLRHMYRRFQRYPDVFDSSLKADLQLDFLTIVRLTTALEELFTS